MLMRTNISYCGLVILEIMVHSLLEQLQLLELGQKYIEKAGVVQNITPKAAIGAGISSYQKSGMAQNITLANVSNWVTNPLVLAGLGSLGASYVSYRMLYPRVRAGVISKVQKFIAYCETLNQDSASRVHTILNWKFVNFLELQNYLPQRWSSHSNKAVYNALSNLLSQAIVAKALLEQVGIDTEQNMYNTLVGYISSLSANKRLYAPVVHWENSQEQQLKRQEVDLANLQANTNLQQQTAGLTQAKTAETYLQMITNIIKDGWNGINYIYKKKYHIAAIAGAGYAYAKGWFGGK